MSVPFSSFLDTVVSRLSTNKPTVRKYLNLKPHAVILDANYLSSIGLSTAQINALHSMAKSKAARNKGEIEGVKGWDPNTQILTLVGGNNLDRARSITSTINKMLKSPRAVGTQTLTAGGGTQEIPLENKKAALSRRVNNSLRNHGIALEQRTLTKVSRRGAKSELVLTIAPLGLSSFKGLSKELDEAFFESTSDLDKESGIYANINNAILASFLGQQIVEDENLLTNKRFIIGKHSKLTFEKVFKASGSLDLFSIKNMLNALLHGKIQEQMRDSTDPVSNNYLRYQTGRFADSARVDKVSTGKTGVLNIGYTYLRYPYDTFLPPAGRQSSVGRSPKRLIVGAIRSIVKDYVSATIRTRSTLIDV